MNREASRQADPLDQALKFLNEGLYEEALSAAEALLKQDLSKQQKSSLQFVIGSSKNSLGNSVEAITHFLEGYAIIASENKLAMLGHFQDELARILFKTKNMNASLFFTEMAISNFELAGNTEMLDSCRKLKETLLWEL